MENKSPIVIFSESRKREFETEQITFHTNIYISKAAQELNEPDDVLLDQIVDYDEEAELDDAGTGISTLEAAKRESHAEMLNQVREYMLARKYSSYDYIDETSAAVMRVGTRYINA